MPNTKIERGKLIEAKLEESKEFQESIEVKKIKNFTLRKISEENFSAKLHENNDVNDIQRELNESIITVKKQNEILSDQLRTQLNSRGNSYREGCEESKYHNKNKNKLDSFRSENSNSVRSIKKTITIRDNSFKEKNKENNYNNLEEESKENEVVICISSLDMKIDESIMIPYNLKKNENKSQNNFLTNLNVKNNKKDFNDFSEINNFNKRKNYKEDTNKISNSNNHFLENTFEQIKFNLNKINSQRDKNFIEINLNTSNNLTENSFKVSKLEIGNSTNNTNMSKSILSAKFNKILDQNTVETEENTKVETNRNKNNLLILLIVLVFILIFGVCLFIFL